MTEKTFDLDKVTEIDAEFMERWLGGVEITSLSPKTMFDIQILLSHYKDIIVPMADVKVEYPVAGFDTACASVDRNEIFIPTTTLQKGEIDNTIGLVIHELNHIKMSEKESVLAKICSGYLMKVMDSIFIQREDGDYDSIRDLLFANGFSINSILNPNPDKEPLPSEAYFRDCLKQVMLLLNSAEDVRIDHLCPPNLKKYIDKLDEQCAKEFVPHYEGGELDENNLLNIVFRFLYHFKGFIQDDHIASSFEKDLKFLLESSPRDYIPVLLKSFADEIKKYCEDNFNQQLFEQSDQSVDSDFVQQLGQQGEEDQFDKTLEDEKDYIEANFPMACFEDSEISADAKPTPKPCYVKTVEASKELLPLPVGMKTSIDVFKNVKVVDCLESFYPNRPTTPYKTLLIA